MLKTFFVVVVIILLQVVFSLSSFKCFLCYLLDLAKKNQVILFLLVEMRKLRPREDKSFAQGDPVRNGARGSWAQVCLAPKTKQLIIFINSKIWSCAQVKACDLSCSSSK